MLGNYEAQPERNTLASSDECVCLGLKSDNNQWRPGGALAADTLDKTNARHLLTHQANWTQGRQQVGGIRPRTCSRHGHSARQEGMAVAGSVVQVIVRALCPPRGQALYLPLCAHCAHLECCHLHACSMRLTLWKKSSVPHPEE